MHRLLVGALALVSLALAPPSAPGAEPAPDPLILELYPGGAPGAPSDGGEEIWEERGRGSVDRSVKNVHRPTITVYRPPAELATGTAVVLFPGGGYSHLAIDKEGHDEAKWFRSIGVLAAVLKYRLPRPEGQTPYTMQTPLDDARQAIRMVREQAAAWGVDPHKVGVVGHSAGGDLAIRASIQFDDVDDPAAVAPDFSVMVYPSNRNRADLQVDSRTPPAFIVHAFDDPTVPAAQSLDYFLALRRAGVSAELHVYSEGGHGFGMLQRGLPVSTWNLRLQDWMRLRGLVR
ncbi:MAG: alpha/beta hydrolase fold domain-containing protein [Acidobacteria bacterium]|nr:alpha/beta hydrolase fold domain-containing protein [Acidobacteriota bacterium]